MKYWKWVCEACSRNVWMLNKFAPHECGNCGGGDFLKIEESDEEGGEKCR